MRAVAFAFSMLVIAGCAGTAGPREPLVLGPFVGTLPCADCPGIARLTLTRAGEFIAEGTYRLEEIGINGGARIVTTGAWTTLRGDAADDDAVVYQLAPDDAAKSRAFVKVNETTIRMLDGELKEVPGLNAVLKISR